MVITRSRAERAWITALVLLIHAGVGWLLMPAGEFLRGGSRSTGLSLVYVSAKRSSPEGIRVVPIPLPQSLRTRVDRAVSIEPVASASDSTGNAISPPIDWADELNRTAEQLNSETPGPKLREFGETHTAPSPAKPSEFGWKRSRTNRLERVTEGTAVHLGEHCVITVNPLPAFSCAPGKKQANGDLFEQMRDSQEVEGDKLP